MTGAAVQAWDAYPTRHGDRRFTWGPKPSAWRRVPGVKVLEPLPGKRMLELGCGTGDNAAHLARLGVDVTALDSSGVQVAEARRRWGGLGNLVVEQVDAVEYLSVAQNLIPAQKFDAVYSVFGAAWFTDPDVLVPLVAASLRVGGLFAVSHAAAPPTGRGRLDSNPAVERWDLSVEQWHATFERSGFAGVHSVQLPRTAFPWPTVLLTGWRG